MAKPAYETHEHDVIVIGAGGAGLRAAIEAAAQGVSVGLVCKSLLGKAHTVMAEGGIAAALGNVWPEDNWQVHFRDTMRGGKMLNNWRMAQLHAQEAPERVLELERWGALFDRTKDGLILQRDFGGHRYARLAHVGDRTGPGDDPHAPVPRHPPGHRRLHGVQDRSACSRTAIACPAPSATGARTARFVVFKAKAVVLATGGIGKAWKVTSNSWEYTGDGHSLALWAGADLIDMEFVQFHPTGMVWPPSVRGILVTESVRGDGGTLKNNKGERFMFNYIPEFFKGETADNERRGRPLVRRQEEQPAHARSAARATRWPARSTPRSRPGGAARTAASSSTSARGARPTTSSKRLPSMYHQFKELAGVDITKEPMEVGPTCHYVMGGVRVDADTTAAHRARPVRGRRGGGRHARLATGSAATRSPTCWSSAGGPGCTPRSTPRTSAASSPSTAGQVESIAREVLEPFERAGGENPYAIQADLQDTMQSLVGIIRTERELKEALKRIEAPQGARGQGARRGRPGRTTPAGTRRSISRSLLTVAECSRPGRAGAQGEPRRPHPRRPSVHRRHVGQGQRGPAPARRAHPGHPRAAARDAGRAQGAASRRGSDADLHDAGVPRRRPPAASSRDYRVEVDEGMVVLDVIHRIQATQAPDLACRWNCKAGKCGSCSAEINGKPRLMCMTRMDLFEPGETDHGGADPDVPAHPRPGHRRLLQLREGQAGPAAAAQAAGARRQVPDDAGGHRSHPGVPQVHRVLPVPGRLPRHPRPRGAQAAFAGPRFFIKVAGLDMHPLDTVDRTEFVKDPGGHRALQHHQVLHRGLPRAHPHHRQRHHPHEGADGRQLRSRSSGCCGSSGAEEPAAELQTCA